MAINIDYTGQFLGGYNKGMQQNFENKTVTNAADAAKQTEQKRMLADQFSQQIKQVTDILRNTDDPVRREAVIKALDQAKAVYTGAEAQQYGLADMFAKQIDFAKETPFEAAKTAADPYAATLAREKAKMDAKQPAKDAAKETGDIQRLEASTNVVDTVDSALKILDDPSIMGQVNKYAATGVFGQMTEGVKASPAGDLDSYIGTIKANLGFEQLQKLRDASPTGGALGQVTEKELAFLQSVLAKLDVGMRPETLRDNLVKVKDSYNRLIENIKAGQAQMAEDPYSGIQPVEMTPTGDMIAPPAPPGGYGNVNDPVPSLTPTAKPDYKSKYGLQ